MRSVAIYFDSSVDISSLPRSIYFSKSIIKLSVVTSVNWHICAVKVLKATGLELL